MFHPLKHTHTDSAIPLDTSTAGIARWTRREAHCCTNNLGGRGKWVKEGSGSRTMDRPPPPAAIGKEAN